jgi:NTP pyrophosphatase (non-canonical NTP hydrolase)
MLPTRKQFQESSFIVAFQNIQADAASINKKNRFNADEELADQLEKFLFGSDALTTFAPVLASFRNARKGLKLAMIMGEVGEALEAVRKNLGCDNHISYYTAEEAELADAVLRIMNYATDHNLRLAEAIVAKNEFNRTRLDHSKEGRAAEHGKQF